ncbi:MAG: CBS domain-containing protein [Candidatus Aenigmarchaeota archaeon]
MVKVSEVMKKDVATAKATASVLDISRTMWNNKFGSVVLCDCKKGHCGNGGKPIGLATWSTIIEAVAKKLTPSKTKVKDLVPRNVITAKEDDALVDVSRKMVKNNVDRMPIVGKDGKLVGIVSYKDILAATPEMMNVLSEKMKATIMRPPHFDERISGLCEDCEGYSSRLRNVDGKWICSDCGNMEG